MLLYFLVKTKYLILSQNLLRFYEKANLFSDKFYIKVSRNL